VECVEKGVVVEWRERSGEERELKLEFGEEYS